MAATSDEEMESLLSAFNQIHEDVKNSISEIQSLQSKHSSELKLREYLQITCNNLKKENEELAKLYSESLKNVADQLDFRAKCMNLKEELERSKNEVIAKEDGHRRALKLLEQEYDGKVASLEAQVKESLHEKATYEATISQLNGDIAAHKNHMQVLANRLDQIHFEVESKYSSEIRDLKDCLMAEQEEKNDLNRKMQNLEKELLLFKAKMVDQQQEMTSNWQVETLKQKIMKLRKENEVLKRMFSHTEEGYQLSGNQPGCFRTQNNFGVVRNYHM
ncbi:protein At-4/1 isoform X2 [Lathyrus oleraceus]|uniref:protein At-4/1 isoform X2 n=1 Tax=Pisum sativum TaxID=3888 RepID=UPI0021CECBD6|nr:protein At-4/1 isoform X2 [Pisum sativum]